MKKSRFTAIQIIRMLEETESGVKVAKTSRLPLGAARCNGMIRDTVWTVRR